MMIDDEDDDDDDDDDEDDDEIKSKQRFCSKCAILMTSKGHKLKELLISDEDFRRVEVEDFLVKLTSFQKKMDNLHHSVVKKKENINIFYLKQSEKAELIVMGLQKLIIEEKKKSLEILNNDKEFSLMEFEEIENKIQINFNEIKNIHNDIEKNLNNIIKNIEIAPFKAIMNKYNEKIGALDRFIEYVDEQQINMTKLAGYNLKGLERIKPLISSFFTPLKISSAITKKNEKLANDKIKDSMSNGSNKTLNVIIPCGNPEDYQHTLSKSSLYISFENRELFENVMNSQAENNRRCSDLYSYTYKNEGIIKNDAGGISHATNGNLNTLKFNKINTTGSHYDTLKIGEETRFIKKADIDLETIMSIKTPKTEKKIQKFISPTANEKKSNGIDESSDRNEEEQQQNEIILVKENYNSNQINPLESNASIQSGCNNGLSSKMFENFGVSNNKSTKKYKNILDKINANQTMKNIYYSDMMKNQMASPRYSQFEDEHTYNEPLSVTKLDDINSDKVIPESAYKAEKPGIMNSNNGNSNVAGAILNDTNLMDINPLNSNGGLNIFTSNINTTTPHAIEMKPENNPQKQLKNYGNFFPFLESKINDEKQNSTSISSYQKTLFCSPNFKDNIEAQEELLI